MNAKLSDDTFRNWLIRDISESSFSTRGKPRRPKYRGNTHHKTVRHVAPSSVHEGECHLHYSDRGHCSEGKSHLCQQNQEGQLPDNTNKPTFVTEQAYLLFRDRRLCHALPTQRCFGRDNAYWLPTNVKILVDGGSSVNILYGHALD